jgi:acetyl esterase
MRMGDDALGRSWEARLAKATIAAGVGALSRMSRRRAEARGELSRFELTTDVAYGSDPAQRYDVWRLRGPSPERRPLVLFLHGGGFQLLDRHSHWPFAERFARAGALVINADYRLAPHHRYPAAADDAARIFECALERAEALGADRDTLIVAGVSAGANLALGLAIEAQARFGVKLRACVSFSGLLQVSDLARLYRTRPMSRLRRARIASIACDYLSSAEARQRPALIDPRLDPLLYLEARAELPPGLPPLFASTGSADDVLTDSLRLHACVASRGAICRLDVQPGAGHAFQGVVHRAAARRVWQRVDAFLKQCAAPVGSATHSQRSET